MPEKLAETHDHIRQGVTELHALLEGACLDVLDELIRKRVALSRLFREHMTADHELARQMAVCGDPAAELIARDFSERLGKFYFHYSSHVRCWSPESITGDWEGYKTGARRVRRSLLQMMEWEESVMLPVLRRMRARPS